MSKSLERHLSRTLALALLLAGLAAGAAAFWFAYGEAQEFQDDSLRQIAALAERQVKGPAFEGDAAPDDQESRIIVLHLPQDARPSWVPADITAGFHTLSSAEGRFRVLVRRKPRGGLIAVAQGTDVRDELAIDSALRTVAPLALLLPLLVWLTVRIVRRELAPVRRLAQNLDEQAADRPQSLPEENILDELAPFVRAINRLLERVNRLMAEQRRFIADAAHELRSPLTALSLQAQNLEKAETVEAMRERVAPLRAGIERARRLTEQLLSLARSQAGTSARETVDVSRMARELIAEFLPVAEAKDIDLGLEERAQLSLVASPESIRLILSNAMENALKYTQQGGEVTLRLLSEDDHAVIEVVDNGPGIPVTERGRVFDAFYRIPGAIGEGSGLGLSIAADAANRMGGALSLYERQDGPGLIFRYRQRRTG